jgi:hypothetical protein
MGEDSSRVVRLVRPRQDDGQGGEFPPEFLQLQQVLDSFVAEARRVLEPKDRHLLDLHLGLADAPAPGALAVAEGPVFSSDRYM